MKQLTTERPLPADLDVERLVLGAMILYPADSIGIATDLLSEADFSTSDHQRTFRRIAALAAAGETIGALTLGMAMVKMNDYPAAGVGSWIMSLTDGVPKIYNLDSYCQALREKSRLRSAILAFSGAATRLWSQGATLETIREEQELIAALDADSEKRESGFKWIADVIENRDAGGFEKFLRPDQGERGIPWPLDSLTAATNGFRAGNVTVVGAGTGKGKTTIATHCALHAASMGYTVAILTPEMTALEITKKITAQHGRKCLSDWLSGTASNSDLAEINRAAAKVHQMRIAIDDRSDVTPAMLGSALNRLEKHGPVHLLIVDYIQLLDSGLRDDEAKREQHVAHISRSIKKLAKSHNLAALVLTQLNDDGKVRESRSIGMDASNVIILNDKSGGNYEAVIQKGRFSARRTIPLWFDGATGIFFEVNNQ